MNRGRSAHNYTIQSAQGVLLVNLRTFAREAHGPKGYRLSQLVIVNPYPVAEFFQEITRLLKPERCVLLVDDGWPPLRVDHITEVLRKAKVLSSVYRVQASTAGGLVHAKMYFFRWRSI